MFTKIAAQREQPTHEAEAGDREDADDVAINTSDVTSDVLDDSDVWLATKYQQPQPNVWVAKHIETGIIGASIPETLKATHAQCFSRPYKNPPKVFISVKHLNEDPATASKGNNYNVFVSDITTSGFNINCEAFHGAYINEIEVHWISYPNPQPNI